MGLSNEKIQFIQELKEQGKTTTEISERVGVSTSTVSKYTQGVSKTIEETLSKQDTKKLDLIKQYTPKQLEEILYRTQLDTKQEIIKDIGQHGYLKFGLVSDTHFGNKMAAKSELSEFYDRAKDKGVECFMHGGDIVDGDSVYAGQIYEQDGIGLDAQKQDIIDNYPNVGLDTYLIGGNHDESFLKKTGGDVCRAISEVRRDLINLGFYDARIKLNGVDINLHHGGGGMSYAKSYKIQKLLENIDPKNQPNVFASGHWHTAVYIFYRKIHSFLPGAFLKENLLAKRFNLDNTIGGWIVEVEIDKNGGSRIGMEFLHIK